MNSSRIPMLCLTLFFVAVACGYLRWFVRDYRAFKLEDSGIFLHIGQRLLHGDVLYRDIADNKPPLIYWINELGLKLDHGSPGGVFFISLLAGLGTFFALLRGLKNDVSWPLFIIVGCWAQLAFLGCSPHPNYTETFSLPLATVAGVLFFHELTSSAQKSWYPVAQGVIGALLFSLRANNSGVEVIYFLYLLVCLRRRNGFRNLVLFVAGGVASSILIVLPLILNGTLREYIRNVFSLAAPYTGETKMSTRLRAFWHGLDLFGVSPLFYFGVVAGIVIAVAKRTHPYSQAMRWMLIWLVLEMLASSTSGYHWDHYYLLWIPPLTIVLMVSGSALLKGIQQPLIFTLLSLALILVVLNEATIQAYRAKSYPKAEDPAIALARQVLHSGDRITTWGHYDHDIWFDLDHRPGTPWFHEGAFTNRKIYQALVPTFLDDLEHNLPRVIVERRSAVPLFAPEKDTEPLNDAFVSTYFTGWDTPAITEKKAELAKHYCEAAQKSDVVVYLLCK